MFLYIDSRDVTQTQVPKIKTISKLNLGGIPAHGHDCLENSVIILMHNTILAQNVMLFIHVCRFINRSNLKDV
jgi:hypothetical protein